MTPPTIPSHLAPQEVVPGDGARAGLHGRMSSSYPRSHRR